MKAKAKIDAKHTSILLQASLVLEILSCRIEINSSARSLVSLPLKPEILCSSAEECIRLSLSLALRSYRWQGKNEYNGDEPFTRAYLSVRIQLSELLSLLTMSSSDRTMVCLDLLKLCPFLSNLAFKLLFVLVEIVHDCAEFVIGFCNVRAIRAIRGVRLDSSAYLSSSS